MKMSMLSLGYGASVGADACVRVPTLSRVHAAGSVGDDVAEQTSGLFNERARRPRRARCRHARAREVEHLVAEARAKRTRKNQHSAAIDGVEQRSRASCGARVGKKALVARDRDDVDETLQLELEHASAERRHAIVAAALVFARCADARLLR